MTSIQIDRLDGLSSSVAYKGPCRVATTANIALYGLQTVDGVALASGDRVLVRSQTAEYENGLYRADTGQWQRVRDFNKTRDAVKGTRVWVTEGDTGPAEYELISENPVRIGTSPIYFELSSGSVNAAALAQAVRWAKEWAQSENPISTGAGGDGATDHSSKWWAERAADYANDALAGGMDPGLSTFVAISALEIPVGIQRFTTGGYSSVADGGGGLVKLVASGPSTAYRKQSADGQWWELAENVPTLEMFGAKGDGATNDTAARNAAYEYVGINGRINLLDGKTYLVSNNDNPDGVTFVGKGQLVTAVTGGLWQRNSYADSKQIHIGGEYLKRAYDFIRTSQGGSSGTLNVHVFGDSTVAEDISGTGERPDVCITQAFQRIGIPNIFVQNQGVSGTKWGDDVYPSGKMTDYISATSGLFIIKYGINDAGYGLETMAANMTSELSAIRSAPNGDLPNLAIILAMPNSTFDSPNGRDARWYETIRQLYVTMSRKFHCAIFDTYALYQDSSPAAGDWMDNPFGDGRSVHPTGTMNRWIYGELIRTFFEGKVDDARTNNFFNEGNVSTTLASNTPPSAFKYGYYHNRAIIANGWPFDGFVITEKNVDQGVLQTFYGYTAGAPRVLRRRSVISTDTWTGWTGTPVAITLSNGWANQGDPWDIPTATPTDDGFVILSGLVNSGTTASGTVMGTLPTGVRPAKDHVFTVAANGGFVRISVHTDGTIKAMGTVDGTWTSFDGAIFRAA